jgi:hypothetical protein
MKPLPIVTAAKHVGGRTVGSLLNKICKNLGIKKIIQEASLEANCGFLVQHEVDPGLPRGASGRVAGLLSLIGAC